jgi:hypothetical protein
VAFRGRVLQQRPLWGVLLVLAYGSPASGDCPNGRLQASDAGERLTLKRKSGNPHLIFGVG